MMNGATQTDCVSLHQQNVSNVLWKSPLSMYLLLNVSCNYFFATFCSREFDPCGRGAATFPVAETSGRRSPRIFLFLPGISISQHKEGKKKTPLGTKEGLNPLPAVCLSISHAINPRGVISLGEAPLMRCSEREAERGRERGRRRREK